MSARARWVGIAMAVAGCAPPDPPPEPSGPIGEALAAVAQDLMGRTPDEMSPQVVAFWAFDTVRAIPPPILGRIHAASGSRVVPAGLLEANDSR